MEQQRPVLLFDGVCNLCNGVVSFTLERNEDFRFAPLQSEEGKRLLEQHGFESDLETFVVVDNHRIYTRSGAVIRLLERLGGGWKIAGKILKLVPRTLRDLGYLAVAKSRYRVFGKKDECMVPSGEARERFL